MINILYCSDNNYAPYLCVSIASLLENNKDAEYINIYVINDKIDAKNIEKLKRQVAAFGESRQLILIDGKYWVEKLELMGVIPYRGGQTANLRLFFTRYIESEVKRLLYIDCDTIICGDLRPLFETDMGDNPIAAVRDSLTTHYIKYLGFDDSESYFNTGIILFDVDNWDKHNCQARLFEIMNGREKEYFKYPDQDILNIALKNMIYILHPKYNFQTTHQVYPNDIYFANYGRIEYYKDKELDEAKSNTVIMHAYRFLGQFPWHKNAIHPWRDIFFDYAKKSEFNDLVPSKNIGMVFFLERCLYRVIPQKTFLRIFKVWQTRNIKRHFAKTPFANCSRGEMK